MSLMISFLLGVPTAITFDMVDCGEGHRGVVYETLHSITLGEMPQTHPEEMDASLGWMK